MKKTLIRSLALAAVGSLMVAGSAMAIPTLEISGTGATTVTISDLDGNGIVSYTSPDFGIFNLAISAGTTKPQDGSAAVPMMHLGGYATTNGVGTFTVKFSETDFGPVDDSITGFLSSMNGSGGVQTLAVYYDANNTLFGEGMKIADIDTLNTDEIFAGLPESSPFSLTMVASIYLDNGTASCDDSVAPVPEPATMFLLGTGLVGLAGVRRRKARK